MAEYDNPQKSFTFGVIAPGLNPYAVQQCDLADTDFDEVTHGQDNHDIKTAGKIKFGDVTINKLRPMVETDNWIWAWVQLIQNAQLGGGALPSIYKRNIRIVQYSADGVTITDAWDLQGAWPKKINGFKLDKTKSENVMEEITFAIDTQTKVL